MLDRFLAPKDSAQASSWPEAHFALGHALLPIFFAVQAVLVPTHILTTDYIDPASRFTVLSIGLRLGVVAFFLALFLLVRRFKLHPNLYSTITFFLNAVTDGLMAAYSGTDYLVTHALGYGVVVIGYAIVPVWSVGLYSAVMFVSTFITAGLFYVLSPLSALEIAKNGGAFVIFFLVLGPAVALLRYTFAKSEYDKRQQIAELLLSVSEKNEELNTLNDDLSRTLNLVQGLKTDLQRKNHDLEDSIRYARRIQDAVIFQPELQQQMATRFVDAGLVLRPRDIVSGDFYFYASVGDYSIVVCADCTGHGIPGAMVSLIGHTLLQKAIVEQRLTAPDQILAYVEREFQRLIASEQVQDGMDAAVLTWNHRTQTGQFAGANRPILIQHEAGYELLKGTPVPIGSSFYKDKQFEVLDLPATAQALWLFSDGMQDQFGFDDDGQNRESARKRKFGFRQMQEILQANVAAPIGVQCQHLAMAVQTWQQNEAQTDDQLIIGLKVR